MKTTLITLHTQTSLHAGSGQHDSVIDLPIQRESHTGYPCIFGSSMKGALRAHAETRSNATAESIARLFGKKGEKDESNAGALLISDARLLLLPIRSLTGQFRWITCPAILRRYKADRKRFGTHCPLPVPDVGEQEILIATNDAPLYLEEYRFHGKKHDLDAWISCFATAIDYENCDTMLRNQLGIVSDNNFAYLASYTLPVTPHVAIDTETKTTVPGALWYEESLPADTLFYAGIAADKERKENGKEPEEIMKEFRNLFAIEHEQWLQIGGNETVGMGWCSVKFAEEN